MTCCINLTGTFNNGLIEGIKKLNWWHDLKNNNNYITFDPFSCGIWTQNFYFLEHFHIKAEIQLNFVQINLQLGSWNSSFVQAVHFQVPMWIDLRIVE